MNPRLVVYLLGSMLFGIGAAVCAVVAGWGILAALVVYSLAGSLSLVAAVAVGAARRAVPLCPSSVKTAAA